MCTIFFITVFFGILQRPCLKSNLADTYSALKLSSARSGTNRGCKRTAEDPQTAARS